MLDNKTIISRGLRSRCPRCGKGSLYGGLLSYAPSCSSCGLDFGPLNADDGPAAFLIFIILAIVVPLAGWLEVAVGPAMWVHILIWAPTILVLTVLLSRPAKALLSGFKFQRGTE